MRGNLVQEVGRLWELGNLQELYLSDNHLTSFLLTDELPSAYIWPHLEVLDLTQNRLRDLAEFSDLFSRRVIRSSTLRVLGLQGNLPLT